MREYLTLAAAYEAGLHAVVAGHAVESVLDPLSKASNFGRGDRPSRERLCYGFAVKNPSSCLVDGPEVRLHLPYCFGLLAFTLAGQNELSILRYYRPGAAEFSDDGWTLSGAFGSRLRGHLGQADQLDVILRRLTMDRASRRTFAPIIRPQDNLRESREYPCAVGIQLFIRDGRLAMLTVMRAQQAFTVLPYDAFLFMALHILLAARLEVPAGPYMHFASTFHIYESEQPAVSATLLAGVKAADLPAPPSGAKATRELVDDLIELEAHLRRAAESGDVALITQCLDTPSRYKLLDVARIVLGSFALAKVGMAADARQLLTQLPTDMGEFAWPSA